MKIKVNRGEKSFAQFYYSIKIERVREGSGKERYIKVNTDHSR